MSRHVWPPMTLEEWSADAHRNGEAMHKAVCAFLKEHGKHVDDLPAPLFNNLKAMLKKAILAYGLQVAKDKVEQ